MAVTATLGSLFYSNVLGYEPCELCWLQRIFIYPQVAMLVVALWKKDYAVFPYVFTLSVIGAFIAGYHYLLQLGVLPSIICSAVESSTTCSQRYVMDLGYITIPMMALTAFLFLALFSGIALLRKTK
ncbi:MAG: disulfide bond formation protein B [bacterium]|nr:disulfide bond formation protein B [bacterium]